MRAQKFHEISETTSDKLQAAQIQWAGLHGLVVLCLVLAAALEVGRLTCLRLWMVQHHPSIFTMRIEYTRNIPVFQESIGIPTVKKFYEVL